MSKKSSKNPQADIKNPNKGTSSTNKIWDKAQGNKGKQMNPNQKSQLNKSVQNCSICQASVKANNMEHHLRKVHNTQGGIENTNQKSLPKPKKTYPKCPICQVLVKPNNMECHLLDVHEVQGEIEKVWQEHNIYEDDEKGMKINVNFIVGNLKGVRCCIAAYFSFQGGEIISGVNDDFMTKNSEAVVSECFTPPYDSTRYNDIELFMPYEELYLAEGCHHHCEFEIQIYVNNTNIVFTESQPFRFSYQKSIHGSANF